MRLLTKLFERLRVANARIPAAPPRPLATVSRARPLARLTLIADTPQATQALGADQLTISQFPFDIGRASADRFVVNHLSIMDAQGAHISRAHISLIQHYGRIGALDRGSRSGSLVNGTRLGRGGVAGPLYFEPGEGTLVLGPDHSPFRFRVLAS